MYLSSLSRLSLDRLGTLASRFARLRCPRFWLTTLSELRVLRVSTIARPPRLVSANMTLCTGTSIISFPVCSPWADLDCPGSDAAMLAIEVRAAVEEVAQ